MARMMNTLGVFLLPLCALSFALLTIADAKPRCSICSPTTPGNFSAYDPFSRHLRKVTASLPIKASRQGGFAMASSGRAAYGLALCLGNVSSEACRTCVAHAAAHLRSKCPVQKEAIVWFDDCLLRYAGFKFFGTIYDGPHCYVWNTQAVPDPRRFNEEVASLLQRVSAKAHRTPRLLGTGEAESGKDGKLYALAQCTRDLSATQCKACLDRAVSELPRCCDGKRGGRVLDGSCNFRYELYPFYGVD